MARNYLFARQMLWLIPFHIVKIPLFLRFYLVISTVFTLDRFLEKTNRFIHFYRSNYYNIHLNFPLFKIIIHFVVFITTLTLFFSPESYLLLASLPFLW